MSIPSATLLMSCPDQKGLVAAVTQFIFQHNGNILHLDQHVDAEAGVFFMRVEWDMSTFGLGREDIETAFGLNVGKRFNMHWTLSFSDQKPRMALFVSKQSHCLYDLLSRWQSGDWNVEIPLIVSNHNTLKSVADSFGIPFFAFEINAGNKSAQEQAQIALVKEHQIDFIVLARYMQILTEKFIGEFPTRIINIHHSFLPAFAGAKPYHAAYTRGVKLIGATSHYVTAELDAGPIIAQDVLPVNHKDSVADLVRKGQDVEKLVLAQAVWNHINNRVLVYNNKTVVFG
ncbi:MAG: formyltetrahydrofolate deformylase [Chloroflexi bacterium]|nr:formyltetrahydrofolate deformylase [Chloroflexota bacterium]